MENLCFQISFSVFSLLCLLVCTTFCQTNFTADESALLDLKFSVRDPYKHLANWSNSFPICNWVGVTCDALHERVRILNLGEVGLKGTLPPQIGNISFLVELDLHGNNFFGQLPKELLQLHKLKILNLSYNEFNGDIPRWIGGLFTLQHLILRNNSFGGVIPPSVSNLSKLETLDCRHNFIEGSIPLEIGRLQHLKILRIARNMLSGAIPSTISNLSSLELMSFTSNSLTGDIPKEISDLRNLKFIYLGVNKLSGHIPRNIGKLNMLQDLEMGDNNLEGEIPYSLFNISSLRKVILFQNKLHGILPKELCLHLPQLEVFSLNDNLFEGSIPRTIGNCTVLQELYLSSNFFTGSIPSEVGDLSKLTILNMGHNKLSGHIPSKIFNISTLEVLHLANNSLSGSLPSDFGRDLPNLEELLLWGNKISGRMPSSISNASKLTTIGLGGNKFTGTIPSTLGDLRYLEILEIENNNLTTTYAPNSESSFLCSMTNCRSLTNLRFSENPLNIKLSKSIGNFSNSLQVLVAKTCGINGSIPSEIGNVSNLVQLNLDDNVLNGPVPVTISNLHGLQYLSLQDNQLHGSIINKLCEIRTLGFLYLSGNKFSGAMPPCLGNLTSLRDLHLGSNNLISEIPSSFWEMKDVLRVNLSSNILVGKLSLGIGNLKSLTFLDLSRNQISGNIPTTIGDLQNLQVLSLALNKLQGSIPKSLGSMLSLEFVDLSHNNLFGEIPKSLESLAYLKYVNFSFNTLQGEIPSGGVFRNLTAESFLMNEALCGKPQLLVPPCKKGARQKLMARLHLLIYILLTVLLIFLVVSCIVLLRHKRQNSSDPVERDLSTLEVPRRISYFEIANATNGFDESNLLGKGSYGSVFKGKLSSGMMVAIKIFNLDSELMSRSFEVECDAMRNLRHRNLVKIISSCSNVDFRSLIMEFMPNGSLEKWLYSHNYCLDFLQRLNVMIDVASALEYLHYGLSTPVVHCDLKPSNILLDDDMTAHVSDFGISKLLDEEQSMTYTQTLPTIGYIAPEYGYAGVVSTKVDVYSYGIILIEVFTRRKPTEDIFVTGLSLKSWVSQSIPHAIIQAIDSNLLQGDEQHIGNIMTSASSIFELALTCCTDFPATRRNMRDVVVSLNKIKVTFMQRQRHHI